MPPARFSVAGRTATRSRLGPSRNPFDWLEPIACPSAIFKQASGRRSLERDHDSQPSSRIGSSAARPRARHGAVHRGHDSALRSGCVAPADRDAHAARRRPVAAPGRGHRAAARDGHTVQPVRGAVRDRSGQGDVERAVSDGATARELPPSRSDRLRTRGDVHGPGQDGARRTSGRSSHPDRLPGETATIVGRFEIVKRADYVTVTGLRLDGVNPTRLPSPMIDSNHVRSATTT